MNKMDQDDLRRYNRIISVIKMIVSNLLQENHKSKGFGSFQDFLNNEKTLHTLFHLKNNVVQCCRDNTMCNTRNGRPLGSEQWNMLYSGIPGQCKGYCHCQFAATQVRTEDLDISLTSLILINCHILKQGEDPMVRNLRSFRNKLYHQAQPVLTETEFNTYKSAIQATVRPIGASRHADLVRILNRPLNENDQENSEPYRFEDCNLKLNQMVDLPAEYEGLTFHKMVDGVTLDDGRLALCCSYMKNGYAYGHLIIYDENTKNWDFMQTDSLPIRIIAVDDSTVAVLLLETPTLASLVLYDIRTTPKLVQTIGQVGIVDFSNKTMELFDNKILVGIGKGMLGLIDRDPRTGLDIIKIKTGMLSQLYVCGDKIIYVLENKEVNCISKSGEEVFNKMLQSSLVALTFLEDDSMYVLYSNDSMQRMSPGGQSCVTVATDGLGSVQDCIQMSYNRCVKKMSLFYISGKIKIFDRTS